MTAVLTDLALAQQNLASAEAWLFDLDGTLINSLPLLKLVYKEYVDSLGGMPTDVEFESLNGCNIAEIMDTILTRLGRADSRSTAVDDYECLLAAKFSEQGSPAISGAELLLEKGLQLGKIMGLVTSAKAGWVGMQVEQRGWGKYFRAIVCDDDTVKVKPDPEPYVEALTRLGTKGKFAVALEDSARGIASAQAAGINVIMLNPNGCESHAENGIPLRLLTES